VEAVGDGLVVATQVLPFVASFEVAGGEGFEADEDAAEARFGGSLDEVAAGDGVDGCCALKDSAHAFHAFEEGFGEAPVAEEMIVEEVEMTTGQAVDFGEGIVDALGVEALSALKEGVFVTEVTVLRTSAGDDDGVWHKVVAAVDEIAANRRYTVEGAASERGVDTLWLSGAKVCEEFGEGLFAGAEEYGVGVMGGLVGKGSYVESAETDECAFAAVVVGDAVGAVGFSDVDLDDDEVGGVFEGEALDMFVYDDGVVIGG
jgi:hypothetical protein